MARRAADVRADAGAGRRRCRRRARRCSRPAPPVTARRPRAISELNAPKLAGQAGWYLARQLQELQAGRARRARERHVRQADDPVRIDARGRRSGPQRRRVHRLAARDAPGRPSVGGNPERGKRCTRPARRATATKGEGIWATNAPRLASMSDWYMAATAGEFPAGHPRHASAGLPRRADGARWRGSLTDEAGDQRSARLHPHAVTTLDQTRSRCTADQ